MTQNEFGDTLGKQFTDHVDIGLSLYVIWIRFQLNHQLRYALDPQYHLPVLVLQTLQLQLLQIRLLSSVGLDFLDFGVVKPNQQLDLRKLKQRLTELDFFGYRFDFRCRIFSMRSIGIQLNRVVCKMFRDDRGGILQLHWYWIIGNYGNFHETIGIYSSLIFEYGCHWSISF